MFDAIEHFLVEALRCRESVDGIESTILACDLTCDARRQEMVSRAEIPNRKIQDMLDLCPFRCYATDQGIKWILVRQRHRRVAKCGNAAAKLVDPRLCF